MYLKSSLLSVLYILVYSQNMCSGKKPDERNNGKSYLRASPSSLISSPIRETTTREYAQKSKIENSCSFKTLDECWAKVPLNMRNKIPTSEQEVVRNCRAFEERMKCLKEFSKRCLTGEQNVQLQSSTIGAEEHYAIMCKDSKFRQDFLNHKDCHEKVSHPWNLCLEQFQHNIYANGSKKWHKVCCSRLEFFDCVGKVASISCPEQAVNFLGRIAKTLLRHDLKSYEPKECELFNKVKCGLTNSGNASILGQTALKYIFLVSFFFIMMQ